MTSAYGGIRYESGVSRMFQYEKTQSRIGKTIWEAPNLYIENSPLFEANKIQTPLVILANDADGAVPWTQGIEFFSALRRLNKPSWLINYNGEPHNLNSSSWGNRMDLSIKLSEFFGHYLKGESAATWLKSGIPALKKETNGYRPTN
jgi:dipeptidyl aminopeptidase/acylaminoacyl peptidase